MAHIEEVQDLGDATPKKGSSSSSAPTTPAKGAPAEGAATKKAPKPVSGIAQLYLNVYNLTLAVTWAYVLYLTVDELVATEGKWAGVYDRVALPLQIAQTAAVLEILHALFGLVRSSVVTTFVQVLSRVTILWVFGYGFPAIRGHWSFTTMVISWAITEVIRYLFYVFSENGLLKYLRYTTFFVLYPTGAGSECLFAFQAASLLAPPQLYALYALLAVYIPGFPYMYTHMIKQRAKVYGKAKKQ